MYQKILVPLDGSKEAELAIGRADHISSQASNGELVIVRVVELVGISNSSSHAIIRALEEQETEAERYLKEVKEGLKCPNVTTLSLNSSSGEGPRCRPHRYDQSGPLGVSRVYCRESD